jgi:CheY-like chemotaxis protein
MARMALVVDDSMLIRHSVCRFLEERGFAVESAANGLEALEILKTVLPDIIVTDIVMPQMDGSELITKLKASPTTARIPVVIIAGRTNQTGPADIRANYVIYKDIEIESQLAKALAAALGDEAIAPA